MKIFLWFLLMLTHPFKFLKKLARNKKGQAGVVGTLIGIVVSLLICIIVVQNLIASQDQAGWSSDANDSWTDLSSNSWTAITLLVILPIIIGAVIILRYVRGGM